MLRTTALILGVAATAAGVSGAAVAAPAPPPVVDVEVTDAGYRMPARITGGMVAMRIRNTGADPHEMAMGRVGRGHTGPQAVAALRRAFTTDAEPPRWIHDVGGVPLLTSGDAITLTRRLSPGTYVVVDATPDRRGRPQLVHGLIRAFAVRGDSRALPPAADGVVTALRTRFEIPWITAGTRTLELRNAAGAGRGFLLASVNPGRTEADVRRWGAAIERTGRLPAGPVPATFLGAIQTIPSGTLVWVTVHLAAGRRYVMFDDESGLMARFRPRAESDPGS